jgi:hypothetical protein
LFPLKKNVPCGKIHHESTYMPHSSFTHVWRRRTIPVLQQRPSTWKCHICNPFKGTNQQRPTKSLKRHERCAYNMYLQP